MNTMQELAAAVIAALNIPDTAPDTDPAEHRMLLARRSGYVQGCLAGLADGDTDAAGYAVAALSRADERVPVPYPVADAGEGEGR